jgi:hypothetical protein
MTKLKSRLNYANVTATLALFVALGGSSYAALKLPRNSVGSTQLRAGSVGSSELRDRSVRLRDVSMSARVALKGQQGPMGPVGVQGPAGAPAVKYFAVATSSGRFVRGNAVSGGREPAVGTYSVGFAENVSGCAYSATLGTSDATAVPSGRIAVSDLGGRVGVQTFDASGAATDLPFHLIVAC